MFCFHSIYRQPQHSLPDVFVWLIGEFSVFITFLVYFRLHLKMRVNHTLGHFMIYDDDILFFTANGKRIAYHRISAREIVFSPTEEESGMFCGKVQTIFLRLPGKQASGPAGWQIRAKLMIYMWLGVVKHKKYFFNGLPKGYEMSQELRNAERSKALAPSNVHYLDRHVSLKRILIKFGFQLNFSIILRLSN